jgi:hypothetical protein
LRPQWQRSQEFLHRGAPVAIRLPKRVSVFAPGGTTMSQRQADLLRMRDMLEHLHLCHQQLQEFDEPNTVHYLTETMLRNLESCRRLCQNLHGVMKLQGAS